MMSETVFLDVPHRDRVWRSTLNGALYRWVDGEGWQVKTTKADWHPAYQGQNLPTNPIYAYPQEKFEEYTEGVGP